MAILALQGSSAAASSACSADPGSTWSFCPRRLCARQLKQDRRHCRETKDGKHIAGKHSTLENTQSVSESRTLSKQLTRGQEAEFRLLYDCTWSMNTAGKGTLSSNSPASMASLA